MGIVDVPVDVDDTHRLFVGERCRVGAIAAVHAHAAAAGDKADDLVAGDRRTAVRQTNHEVVEAVDVHTDGVAAVGSFVATWLVNGRRELLVVARCVAAQRTTDPMGDTTRRDVMLTDRGEEGVDVGVAVFDDHLGEGVGVPDLLHRQAFASQLVGELVAALLDHVVATLATEPLLDLVLRLVRGDELQPIL